MADTVCEYHCVLLLRPAHCVLVLVAFWLLLQDYCTFACWCLLWSSRLWLYCRPCLVRVIHGVSQCVAIKARARCSLCINPDGFLTFIARLLHSRLLVSSVVFLSMALMAFWLLLQDYCTLVCWCLLWSSRLWLYCRPCLVRVIHGVSQCVAINARARCSLCINPDGFLTFIARLLHSRLLVSSVVFSSMAVLQALSCMCNSRSITVCCY